MVINKEKAENAMHFQQPPISLNNQATKKEKEINKDRKKVGCKTWKIIDSEIRKMRLFH